MTLLDVLLELLKPKKKTATPEPVHPYSLKGEAISPYTGIAISLVSGKAYFEKGRNVQLVSELSRVSGYFGVGRVPAAREEKIEIAPAAPTSYVPETPVIYAPAPTISAAPTYITEAPVVTPTRPEPTPTPTPTPSISPSQAISAGVVSAGREFTREQAPIRPPPTPSEVLSAGIAKARYGK